jgi:hypothetical protein
MNGGIQKVNMIDDDAGLGIRRLGYFNRFPDQVKLISTVF